MLLKEHLLEDFTKEEMLGVAKYLGLKKVSRLKKETLVGEIAEKFCLLSLEVGEQHRSYEAKASMKFIADTLGAMLRRRVISRKDLYTYSDKVIMDIGLNCSDKRISDRWKYLKDLNRVHKKFNNDMAKHCQKIDMNLLYVDPLIRLKNGGCMRASENSIECKEAINRFLNSDTDLYFYVDYED